MKELCTLYARWAGVDPEQVTPLTQAGSNRRYYRITALGQAMLSQYRLDWEEHKKNIETVLKEETK